MNRQAKKEARKTAGRESSSDSLSSSSADSQKDGGEGDPKNEDKEKTAVRNLRQREDLPKYLRNLDPNSAHYEPKSRTMKDNPNPDLPENQLTFKGDNAVKLSGDALKAMQ